MFVRIDQTEMEKAKTILKERNLTCVSIVRQLFKAIITDANKVINTLYTN